MKRHIKRYLMLLLALILLCSAATVSLADAANTPEATSTADAVNTPEASGTPEAANTAEAVSTAEAASMADTPEAADAAGAVNATDAAQQPITVGITTQMSGDFYSDMWGNNTVDADVRSMLHGYDTVVWKTAGGYGVDDTVVTDMSVVDGNGSRTYVITLADDLTYNDGTPITAADYVFAILLQSDPSITQLGGMNTNYSHVNGWQEYAQEQSDVLSGVRLLGELQFSISVPDSALPYFYELSYMSVQPCPITVIAPDYTVQDDGNGAYLALPDVGGTLVPSKLTPELLSTTFTAPEGYLHMPMLTCGPYQLVTYDAQNNTVSLSINTYYKGNYEGQLPHIEQVSVVQVTSETAIEAFRNGEVQILHKLSDGAAITEANAMVANGEALTSNYLRSGYAFLGYACELAPLDDVAVRQAIALCIDRETLVNTVFAGNGLSVSGYYGYGQWMAAQHMDDLAQFNIGYDVNAAQTLLENAGYIYNETGADFVPGAGQVRCKIDNGVIVPLQLSWAKAKSTASDALELQLLPVLDELGIHVTVREMTFAELLAEYYREDGARTDQLYFLSDNFFHVFDPYFTYNTGDEWQGVFNTSGLRSTELMDAAAAMRSVPDNDSDTYYQNWLAFQTIWHQLMPTAPIYSNVYFDVCIPTLNNYQPGSQYGFSSALLYASIGDAAAPEATAAPTDDPNGDVITIE